MQGQSTKELQIAARQRLLTPPQVSDFLQVKLDRVYELVWTKRLRAVRIGRQLRFREQDLETFVERSSTV
jgi:excisionase family DNA binding protein